MGDFVGMARREPLRRLVGAWTALLLGMGVAIGSGIFRTPGEVAGALPSAGWMLLVWVLGGLIVMVQGLVTAELATRFPEAGGEYVFLREAYGEFVAFFFGWAYTVFIIGGGAAAISLAFGDFACALWSIRADRAGWFAACAILAVTGVNCLGLRAGAGVQNALTGIKILALVAIVGIGLVLGTEPLTAPASAQVEEGASAFRLTVSAFLAGLLPVLWSYNGTTDAVKLAEEIHDVRRALPRAVIGSTAALIVLYAAVNVALLRIVPAADMAGNTSAPGEAMSRLFGPGGRTAMLIAGMLVCLGSLGSTVLATIRVTFALARDGLTFNVLSRMSRSQAPIPALLAVAAFAIALVLNANFMEVLDIYFFASAILFGLAYASLIVFRRRTHSATADYFRCPLGVGMAGFLIVFQGALAYDIARRSSKGAGYILAFTLALIAAFGAFYLVWKRFRRIGKRDGVHIP
jgi:APA family basic amino acid/polyamine antiporter